MGWALQVVPSLCSNTNPVLQSLLVGRWTGACKGKVVENLLRLQCLLQCYSHLSERKVCHGQACPLTRLCQVSTKSKRQKKITERRIWCWPGRVLGKGCLVSCTLLPALYLKHPAIISVMPGVLSFVPTLLGDLQKCYLRPHHSVTGVGMLSL